MLAGLAVKPHQPRLDGGHADAKFAGDCAARSTFKEQNENFLLIGVGCHGRPAHQANRRDTFSGNQRMHGDIGSPVLLGLRAG